MIRADSSTRCESSNISRTEPKRDLMPIRLLYSQSRYYYYLKTYRSKLACDVVLYIKIKTRYHWGLQGSLTLKCPLQALLGFRPNWLFCKSPRVSCWRCVWRRFYLEPCGCALPVVCSFGWWVRPSVCPWSPALISLRDAAGLRIASAFCWSRSRLALSSSPFFAARSFGWNN